jgi:hypothetical protein
VQTFEERTFEDIESRSSGYRLFPSVIGDIMIIRGVVALRADAASSTDLNVYEWIGRRGHRAQIGWAPGAEAFHGQRCGGFVFLALPAAF